jgi:hypothetical protein
MSRTFLSDLSFRLPIAGSLYLHTWKELGRHLVAVLRRRPDAHALLFYARAAIAPDGGIVLCDITLAVTRDGRGVYEVHVPGAPPRTPYQH